MTLSEIREILAESILRDPTKSALTLEERVSHAAEALHHKLNTPDPRVREWLLQSQAKGMLR